MAEINLSKEETIKVNLSSESPINANVPEINYIPGYKIAEEQRRSNELERIANESEREDYFEDMVQKVENDYFKGEKGDKGDKGDIGLSNTLTIGTVVKGDNAEATLTGESPNQILNLTLPKGDKGEQGIQGIQGIQGPTGPQGPKGDAFKYSDFTQAQLEALRGPQGPQGIRGPQGATGGIGPQGEKGDTGATGPANKLTIGSVSKGDNAEATITGTSPNQVLNLVLPKGDAFTYEDFTQEQLEGLTGPKGDKGDTPINGVDYFTEEEQEEFENDVIARIQPTLNNNLKQAKDYTDNAIIKDFKDISYNQETCTFVFTRHDNTTFTVDLPIEQTVKNGYYDETNKDLVLVLVSDQEIRIPASGLIDDYTGVDSATIQCVISADNKITCNIIGGSITKTLLTTELQEEINNAVKQVEYSQTSTLPSGSDGGYYGRAYVRDKTNMENSIPLCSQNRNYTIPIRDHNGNFYVGNPTIAYHCANKQYVDNLVGNIESLLSEV